MNPGMRLKVRGDTFYLPDAEGGVYFRNNNGSFRMQGSMIDKWIERLVPVFNGEHTLEELTGGLPEAHRNRLYEIAETLQQNGFVRDVSADRQYELPESVKRKFAGQMEFLDHFGGSGAFEFGRYREARVLAAGSGSFVLSLVSALLDSGLPVMNWLMTDATPENRRRVDELADYARSADPDVRVEEVEEVERTANGSLIWREIVKPFDWILYVSREGGESGELRELQDVCREEGKALIPAVVLRQVGVAGPLALPGSHVGWESAWRRLHRAAIEREQQLHVISSTAEALLANAVAFELFKTIAGAVEPEWQQRVYLLNLETLEGSRHAVLPHPLADGRSLPDWRTAVSYDLPPLLETNEETPEGWLAGFSRLASAVTGIFHIWEEGDLKQLPLSQCRIQAVDPLSPGPAELLPERICGGFTHADARRDAGLSGIEDYVARLISAEPLLGIGAGETVEEGIGRALQHALTAELRAWVSSSQPLVYQVDQGQVKDERTRFYLTSLITMRGEPVIGCGDNLFGLPVMWVGSGGRWYGSVGWTGQSALRNALLHTLLAVQNHAEQPAQTAVIHPSVRMAEARGQMTAMSAGEEEGTRVGLEAALKTMKRNGANPRFYDLALEPFLKDYLAGVFGVMLREEENPR